MLKEGCSDILLWEKIKSGDTLAFNKLYKQYADTLFSFALLFTNDREAIKDNIHDLFLELYKYRKNLADTDNIKNYLFLSLKRKILTSKKPKLPLVYSDKINDSNNHEKDNSMILEMEEETIEKLKNEIEKLPERQREALMLRFSTELSYEKIAEIMSISVESVRTLVYRSVKTLRLTLSSELKKKH